MAVITRGDIVDFLDSNLNSVWQDGLKRWPEEYSQIFNVRDSDKQSERDTYESGFPAFPVKEEGTSAQYAKIFPGIPARYVHQTYALGYEITEEAIEDNQHTPETFSKLPEALKGAAMETVEVTAFSVFNTAFSTNGPDGVPLFSTAHPFANGGGSQSNTPSTPADLSVTSLKNAITAFGQFVDEQGLHKAMTPNRLLVAWDNWDVAYELTESEYKPYTSNNERNALMTKNIRPVISHYLTDADAWFLLSDDNHLNFYWRSRLGDLRKSTDFDSTNLKHLGRMRFSVGYSHYMGIYGNPGA